MCSNFWLFVFLLDPCWAGDCRVGQQSCGRVCCVERLKVSKVYISKGRDWLKTSKITKEINRGQNSFASMPLKILHKCVIGPRYSSDDLNYGQSGNKKNVERLNDMLFNQMKRLMSIVWHFVLMMGFLPQLVENRMVIFRNPYNPIHSALWKPKKSNSINNKWIWYKTHKSWP